MATGRKLLKEVLADIPPLPGVYSMLNIDRQVIYIGKAKNLKKRLASYARTKLPNRVSRMVYQIYFLEYIVTKTEAEAFLMEASLIRDYQPRFNILLRVSRSSSYINLRLNHSYPQPVKHRHKDSGGEKLFGPFASGYQVDIAINELYRIFKLRSCTDSYFASRERPCLQYQIGQCFGPCTGKISKENYMDLVNQAHNFLLGKTAEIQQQLYKKMTALSREGLYEEAAVIRDRIKALSNTSLTSGVPYTGVIDTDIIALAEERSAYCIQVFLYRAQGWGSKAYFPVHTEERKPADILESFMGQFYQTRTPPKEIITNYSLREPVLIIKALKQLYSTKTRITNPKRGEKAKLVHYAYLNARAALEHHLKK